MATETALNTGLLSANTRQKDKQTQRPSPVTQDAQIDPIYGRINEPSEDVHIYDAYGVETELFQQEGYVKVLVSHMEPISEEFSEYLVSARQIARRIRSSTLPNSNLARNNTIRASAAAERVITVDSIAAQHRQRKQSNQLRLLIEDVFKCASKPDWDGEEASPVHKSTMSVAKKLADFLPILSEHGTLEVHASAFGEINFEWTIAIDKQFAVGVGPPPNHDIAFSLLVGHARWNGREPWEERLPTVIRCCLERLSQ